MDPMSISTTAGSPKGGHGVPRLLANPVRPALAGAVGLVALCAAWDSFFTVPQNSAASVTRFGALVRGPLSPGLHAKLPFVETVYTLPISTGRVDIPRVVTTTVDNQFVYLNDMTVTYHIPVENVNQALFRVGRMGTGGIFENAVPVIMDRTLRVFGRVNTIDVNPKKDDLARQIMAEAAPDVARMFGIVIDSVQLPNIDYDDRFKASIAAANDAKMKIIKAQADTEAAKQEAMRAAATAAGQANAQVEQARGQAESQKVAADAQAHVTEVQARAQAEAVNVTTEANARQVRALGEARAAAIRAKVEAVGGAATYVAQLQAEALGRWNGSVPQVMLGGDKAGPQAFLPLPLLLPQGPAPVAAR